MWQAFRNGSVYDLSSGDTVVDDPHGGHPWGADRTVRARIVCWLLLDGPPALAGRVSSLKLTGVQISGTLDLAGGTVVPYIELKGCRFEKEVLLPEARFTTVRLVNCSVPRLEAARVHTEGDLHLPRCRFHNGARLTDAHIGTDLLLNQAVVYRDRRGRSIAGDGMSVGQDLQAEMLESHGELSLRGATIGVSLSLRGSRLTNPYGRLALNAPQLTVGRTLYLTPAGVWNPMVTSGTTPARGTRIQRFECQGGIRLDDGRFGDSVDLERARLTFTDEQELSLRRVQTPELRFLGERPERGKVVLSGAKVVNLVDRAGSWPGPGNLHMGGFGYENLVPQGPFPRRSGWHGWRRRPPSTARSRTSGWPRSCATAARTRTRARCCSPSSAAAARPCRPRPSCGGTCRTGRSPTDTGPAGPPCGWRCCGRRPRWRSRTPAIRR